MAINKIKQPEYTKRKADMAPVFIGLCQKFTEMLISLQQQLKTTFEVSPLCSPKHITVSADVHVQQREKNSQPWEARTPARRYN